MKLKLLFLFLVFCTTIVRSQCLNAGFELGNFTGWQGTRGNCCPINLTNNGIVFNRHTITSGLGTDPRTCNIVPVVCPWGGNFSARLGNWQRGSQAEGLSYTFVPSAASALFTYSYAVVFEEPGHTPDEQPRFETQVIANGQVIPCTQYMVSASSNLPGFQTCPGIDWQGLPINIVYRNWSTVGVDLTPFIGQSVTIEFKTGDCSLGKHYGYAYLDAISCQPMDIEVNYCIGDQSAVLTAPSGFSHYEWSTGDTTRIITVNPSFINQVTCTIISFSGCIANLTTNLAPADPQISFTSNSPCFGSQLLISNTSTSVHSPIVTWVWNFGDNTTSSLQNPVHTYLAPGQYTVTLIGITALGCSDTISNIITVHPNPIISVTSDVICPGESGYLFSSGALNYTWSPSSWLNTASGSSVISNTPSTITYTVTGIDQNGCTGTGTGTVTVAPVPLPPSNISHN